MPPAAPQAAETALRDVLPERTEDWGPSVRGKGGGEETDVVEEEGERDAAVEEKGDEGVDLGGEDGAAEKAREDE